MARTPIFRLVRRAARAARASRRCGVPPAELLEAARERAARQPSGGSASAAIDVRSELSRRQFVVGAGAFAGLTLAGCRTSLAPAAAGRPDVLVVGAGIAGLTAAYRLAAAGRSVQVHEAQERVGGRMLSLRGHFADGQVAELGGELIDTGHTAIRGLAQELGIALDDLAGGENPALATDVFWFGGARRSEAEVVEAFLPIAARIEEALTAVPEDGVTYRQPGGAAPLDRLTLTDWLERAGARGWIRDLLDIAYTAEYGLPAAEQSALNLLLLIDPQAGSPEDPEFRIFGDSDERFHVRGGNDLIPSALAGRLGDRIVLGSRLERVTLDADGAVRCSFGGAHGAREVAADHLVLALPFTLLRQIELALELPAAKRQAIAELGYGTNAKLMIGYAERVWRERHGSNGSVLADLPFQITWEASREQAGRAGILTNFTGGAAGLALGDGTPAAQAARVCAELEAVFPGIVAAREGQAEARFHWPTHPWTRGSYACYRPGQWTAFAGAEGEAVGNVHFAGEHTSLAAQGFMEGGCESGERVAREILAAGTRRRRAA